MTLPLGTPQDTFLCEELNVPILVHCILLCKKLEHSLCETSQVNSCLQCKYTAIEPHFNQQSLKQAAQVGRKTAKAVT